LTIESMLPAVTPKNRFGLPSARKAFGRQPVGLADDADAKTLRFEQTPDQRHAEARVVDVGVAGDEDDVARIPAEFVHFGARHRQEGCRAEAAGPVFAVREEIAGALLREGQRRVFMGRFYRNRPLLALVRREFGE
jgi:hypothetical protein